MAYPQPGTALSTPPSQEPINAVLQQATSTMEDVEKRLNALINRIHSRPDENIKTALAQPCGLMNQSLNLRNISSRSLENVAQLENLLG